jgi:hypothetical protein
VFENEQFLFLHGQKIHPSQDESVTDIDLRVLRFSYDHKIHPQGTGTLLMGVISL